jgi:Skp family chaperone for outer membrane proteins
MREQIEQLKMIGFAYTNAAYFLARVAREQNINAKMIARHNNRLRMIAEMEKELARLQEKLVSMKADAADK